MDCFDGDLFDPDADFDQWDRTRPHRHQSAAICFLTMRLKDSIPKSVILDWHRQRVDFLRRNGVHVDRDWKAGYLELSPDQQQQFDKRFSRQRETTLDSCLGACDLANPIASEVVAQSFAKFHGDRYWLGDFVIMPNHVHLLVAFRSNEIAKSQPGGWMRYTARQINQLTERTGSLWFPEPFDHLVRNEDQLEYLRAYIRDNPTKAHIEEGRFLYRASGGRF